MLGEEFDNQLQGSAERITQLETVDEHIREELIELKMLSDINYKNNQRLLPSQKIALMMPDAEQKNLLSPSKKDS